MPKRFIFILEQWLDSDFHFPIYNFENKINYCVILPLLVNFCISGLSKYLVLNKKTAFDSEKHFYLKKHGKSSKFIGHSSNRKDLTVAYYFYGTHFLVVCNDYLSSKFLLKQIKFYFKNTLQIFLSFSEYCFLK